MDYNETLKTLQEMESRYSDGFSTLDRSFLDTLYYELFGKEITNRGCSDCYRDAYMEIKIKLKKDKAMPKKTDYKLKAGALIQFFGEAGAYTNANLTDAVAERYLGLNEANIIQFAEYPDNWRTRVAEALVNAQSAEGDDYANAQTLEQARLTIQGYKQENEELHAEIDRLNSVLAENEIAPSADPTPDTPNEEADALRLELGAANDQMEKDKAEIERLSAEVENLKKENKGLKAANTKLKNKASEEAPASEENAL